MRIGAKAHRVVCNGATRAQRAAVQPFNQLAEAIKVKPCRVVIAFAVKPEWREGWIIFLFSVVTSTPGQCAVAAMSIRS